MPQCKTEPWLHLSDNDGQKLQSLQWFSADANCPRQSRRGIWHGHHSKQEELWERESPDPVRASRHTPHIHHTNKHLKQSPHNQVQSVFASFVQCTLSVLLFYCLVQGNNKSVIYRHIKHKFCGFRPGERIVWSMTCWLPAQPIDQ